MNALVQHSAQGSIELFDSSACVFQYGKKLKDPQAENLANADSKMKHQKLELANVKNT